MEAHRQMLSQDAQVSNATQRTSEQTPSADRSAEAGTGKYIRYQQLIRRIRDIVHDRLPFDARVIVVSKGDDELLKLGTGRAWHFPQSANGTYTGHHPADSAAAIAHLEEVRARGADYLLFPSTAFWWLDFYADFRHHLDSRYSRVLDEPDCIIYRFVPAHSE